MNSGPTSAELARGSALATLRRKWGHCYDISYDDQGWVARRRDDDTEIRRDAPLFLLLALQDDHAEHPVPEQCRTPEAP